ncbi:MAG: hypothetical protein ACK4YV_04195 [Emticicia sp.]
MNTLIIEPNTKVDYQLFVSLAKRLNVKFREEKVVKVEAKKEKSFNDFFGAFEDIDADAMIKDIVNSHTTKDIDTSWVK